MGGPTHNTEAPVPEVKPEEQPAPVETKEEAAPVTEEATTE